MPQPDPFEMSNFADLAIVARGRRRGQHRALCPDCAKFKPRHRDDAFAVKVEPGGTAIFFCHRCGFRGAVGSREMPHRRLKRGETNLLAEEPDKPFPTAAARLWTQCHPVRTPLPGEVPAGELMAVRSFGPARMRFALFGAVPAGLTDRSIEVFVRSIAPPEHVRLLDELEAIMQEVGR